MTFISFWHVALKRCKCEKHGWEKNVPGVDAKLFRKLSSKGFLPGQRDVGPQGLFWVQRSGFWLVIMSHFQVGSSCDGGGTEMHCRECFGGLGTTQVALSSRVTFFFNTDNVHMVWLLIALDVSCLPYLPLGFGFLDVLGWDSSRSLAAFLTCSEMFWIFVANFLSLENYQLALIHFLLSFTAKRST